MSSPDCYGKHGKHLCAGCVHENGCRHITMHMDRTQSVIDHVTSYNELLQAKDEEIKQLKEEISKLKLLISDMYHLLDECDTTLFQDEATSIYERYETI